MVKSFQCQQCGACCVQPGFVYLKEKEADTIAIWMKMDVYDFTEKYCELVDRQRLVLKKTPDEACVFFSEGHCLIHAVKPKQCRDFPMEWKTPKSLIYCEGLRK